METAIYTYLISQVDITNLVSTRIYPIHLPTEPTYPAITYNIISVPYDHHLMGLSGVARARVQFDCWSKSIVTASTIAEALLNNLDAYGGMMGSLWVDWVSIDNEFNFAFPPTDGSANWTYRKTQDYIFTFND